MENTSPPHPPEGGISADVIWRKKCEKGKRKNGENVKEKGKRGKKLKKWEISG